MSMTRMSRPIFSSAALMVGENSVSVINTSVSP